MAQKALNRFTHDTFKYKSIAVQTLECEGRHQGIAILSSRHIFSVDAVCRFQTKHKGPKLVAFYPLHKRLARGGGGGGVPPYIRHVSMRRPKGYGFGAFLVWKRVYTLPILVLCRVWFSRDLRDYERISCFNFKWIRTKWKYANSNYICGIFCLRSNLSIYDDIISAKRPSLKNG